MHPRGPVQGIFQTKCNACGSRMQRHTEIGRGTQSNSEEQRRVIPEPWTGEKGDRGEGGQCTSRETQNQRPEQRRD
ncbi:hypothetical protein GJAV_G00115280 [Gymnothorax javanicus]|nr:hypothetical protein GJAV_G00115280 [Gymnothorax javanicus]